MAADVDICNLALGRIGDGANVASINPPDNSVQAEHCARFYPLARNSLLDMFPWGFAMKRVSLASLVPWTTAWQYAYSAPLDAVGYLAIQDPAANDDYSAGIPSGSCDWGDFNQSYPSDLGFLTPQPFIDEINPVDGTPVILTNQPNAVLRYTALITDATKFSPLFTDALTWLLASYLAGPIIKGMTGMQVAKGMKEGFMVALNQATISDSNQRRVQIAPQTPWLVGR